MRLDKQTDLEVLDTFRKADAVHPGSKREALKKADALAELIIELRKRGYRHNGSQFVKEIV